MFLETLDEINSVSRTAKQEIEERFIATVACKAAVKANMALTKERKAEFALRDWMNVNNLSDVEYAILETSGQISVILKAKKRGVTPEDLNLNPKQDYLVSNIIINGKVIKENLSNTGNNLNWLQINLEKQRRNSDVTRNI